MSTPHHFRVRDYLHEVEPLGGRRPPAPPCRICGRSTAVSRRDRSARKPLCSHCAERMPYAIQVIATMIERIEEVERVAQHGARHVQLEGLVVREVLCYMYGRGGAATASRLAIEVVEGTASHEVMEAYVRRLQTAGLVRVTPAKDTICARLTKAGVEWVEAVINEAGK